MTALGACFGSKTARIAIVASTLAGALAMATAAPAATPAATPAGASDAGSDTSAPAVEARLMAAVIRVADAPATAAFYERALGMKTLMSRDLGAIHETMLGFTGPGVTGPGFAGASGAPGIMLVSRVAPSSEPLHGAGATRLIVGVASLDAVIARLDAAGLAHGTIRNVAPGVRVLDLIDPERNELELVEKTPAK